MLQSTLFINITDQIRVDIIGYLITSLLLVLNTICLIFRTYITYLFHRKISENWDNFLVQRLSANFQFQFSFNKTKYSSYFFWHFKDTQFLFWLQHDASSYSKSLNKIFTIKCYENLYINIRTCRINLALYITRTVSNKQMGKNLINTTQQIIQYNNVDKVCI